MLLERAIIQALKIVSPDTLYVLAGRQGVEPAFPYCLVTLVNTKNVGSPDRIMTFDVVDGVEVTVEKVVQVKQAVFHLSFLSLAADAFQDKAEWFHTGFGSSFFIHAFSSVGLGILNAKTIVPTIEVENGVENYLCTTISLTVSYQRIDTFFADRITEAVVQGDVDGIEDYVNVDVKL